MTIELVELMRWTRVPLATGGVILIEPGGAGWSVRVHPRQRPLRALREIVSRLPDAVHVGPIQHITTATGEHAGLMSLRLELDGVPHTRTIGMVIGDDDYTLIEGMARDPSIAGLVEQLLRTSVQPAAPDRVRMVPYRMPAGWFGVRRPLATCWLAPRYPRDRARLVVCDAVPLAGGAAMTQDLLWPFAASPDHHDLRTPTGITETIDRTPLHGTLTHGEHDGATWAIADLTDCRFRYRVQLHDGNAAALSALRAIADSLEPVAVPADPVAHAAQEAFAWLD